MSSYPPVLSFLILLLLPLLFCTLPFSPVSFLCFSTNLLLLPVPLISSLLLLDPKHVEPLLHLPRKLRTIFCAVTLGRYVAHAD